MDAIAVEAEAEAVCKYTASTSLVKTKVVTAAQVEKNV